MLANQFLTMCTCVPLPEVATDPPYLPSLIQSATLSPTRIAVALVLARVIWGRTEQSATRRFSTPRTRQYWSATAIGSESGPMRQVQE